MCQEKLDVESKLYFEWKAQKNLYKRIRGWDKHTPNTFCVISFNNTTRLYIWKLETPFTQQTFCSPIYIVTSSASLLSGPPITAPKHHRFHMSNSCLSIRPHFSLCIPWNLPDNSCPHDTFFILNYHGLLKVGVGGKMYSSIARYQALWQVHTYFPYREN